MATNEKYHLHKACAFYPNCIEKEDKVDGHMVIRLWCPKKSEVLHQRTGKFKGKIFNYGESYDRVGGYPHYRNDLHTVKVDCTLFEPAQMLI